MPVGFPAAFTEGYTHTHMLTLTHMLTYAIISWERGCRVKKKEKKKK